MVAKLFARGHAERVPLEPHIEICTFHEIENNRLLLQGPASIGDESTFVAPGLSSLLQIDVAKYPIKPNFLYPDSKSSI